MKFYKGSKESPNLDLHVHKMDSHPWIQWNHTWVFPLVSKVDSLSVSSWYAKDNQEVLSLLSIYEVKKLFFFAKRLPQRMVVPIVAQPCLHLETIMVEHSAFVKDHIAHALFDSLRCLWVNSRVKTLVIVLATDEASTFNPVYEQLLQSGIDKSFSLLKVSFQREGTKLRSGKAAASREVKNYLSRNRLYLKRCQTAATIFLTKRIIERQIDPNVYKIIARMVWETRGTKEWNRKKKKAGTK